MKSVIAYRGYMFLCRLLAWAFLKALYIYKDGNLDVTRWRVGVFSHDDISNVPEGYYVAFEIELGKK